MTEPQKANALITYFEAKFNSKYNGKRQPHINRIKKRWDMRLLMEDIGFEDAKRLMDYFFEVPRSTYDFNWFLNNYDRLLEERERQEEDRENRQKLKKETEERVKAWKEKYELRS